MKIVDLLIDASALKELRCARLFQFRVCWGMPFVANEYVTFGILGHKIAELKERGQLPNSPLEWIELLKKFQLDMATYFTSLVGVVDALNTRNMPKILVGDKLGLEYRFLLEYQDIHVGDTLYHVSLCGTMDRIEEYQGDPTMALIRDWKTTSKPPTPYVPEEFASGFQLRFYLWIFEQYLRERFERQYVCAKITTIHYRAPIVQLLDSAEIVLTEDLHRDIPQMIHDSLQKVVAIAELGDRLAYPEGTLYNACAHCDFKNICKLPEKEILSLVAETEKKPYNPLTHGEI